MLKRRRIDVACIDKTKRKAKSSVTGYGNKLSYDEASNKRIGVAVVVTKRFCDQISLVSDLLMTLKSTLAVRP